jgi:hypothetical protein
LVEGFDRIILTEERVVEFGLAVVVAEEEIEAGFFGGVSGPWGSGGVLEPEAWARERTAGDADTGVEREAGGAVGAEPFEEERAFEGATVHAAHAEGGGV